MKQHRSNIDVKKTEKKKTDKTLSRPEVRMNITRCFAAAKGHHQWLKAEQMHRESKQPFPCESSVYFKIIIIWNGLWSLGFKRSVQMCVIQITSICSWNTKSFSYRNLFYPFLNLKKRTSIPNSISFLRCLLTNELSTLGYKSFAKEIPVWE